MTKIIKKYKEIGKVTFSQTKRAKNIGISLRPWQGIRVYFPPQISPKQAEKFLSQKIDWVKNKLNKLSNYEKTRTKHKIGDVIQTDFHEIHILPAQNSNFYCERNNKQINIKVNKHKIRNLEIQSKIREKLIEIYRQEAHMWFPPRVKKYATKYNFDYNKVYIKSQKTIWGSCSSKDNININLNLMRLEIKYRDYIILHELTHLRHPDHSQKFWETLANFIQNPKQIDKKLRQHNPRKYQP